MNTVMVSNKHTQGLIQNTNGTPKILRQKVNTNSEDSLVDKDNRHEDMNLNFKGCGTNTGQFSLTLKTHWNSR